MAGYLPLRHPEKWRGVNGARVSLYSIGAIGPGVRSPAESSKYHDIAALRIIAIIRSAEQSGLPAAQANQALKTFFF